MTRTETNETRIFNPQTELNQLESHIAWLQDYTLHNKGYDGFASFEKDLKRSLEDKVKLNEEINRNKMINLPVTYVEGYSRPAMTSDETEVASLRNEMNSLREEIKTFKNGSTLVETPTAREISLQNELDAVRAENEELRNRAEMTVSPDQEHDEAGRTDKEKASEFPGLVELAEEVKSVPLDPVVATAQRGSVDYEELRAKHHKRNRDRTIATWKKRGIYGAAIGAAAIGVIAFLRSCVGGVSDTTVQVVPNQTPTEVPTATLLPTHTPTETPTVVPTAVPDLTKPETYMNQGKTYEDCDDVLTDVKKDTNLRESLKIEGRRLGISEAQLFNVICKEPEQYREWQKQNPSKFPDFTRMYYIIGGALGSAGVQHWENPTNGNILKFNKDEMYFSLSYGGKDFLVKVTCGNLVPEVKIVVLPTVRPFVPTARPAVVPTEVVPTPTETSEETPTPAPTPTKGQGGSGGGSNGGGGSSSSSQPTPTTGTSSENTPTTVAGPTNTLVPGGQPTIVPQTRIPTVATPGIGNTPTPETVVTPPATKLPTGPTVVFAPTIVAQTAIPLVATPGIGSVPTAEVKVAPPATKLPNTPVAATSIPATSIPASPPTIAPGH